MLLQQHLRVKVVAFLLQALIFVVKEFIFFLNFGDGEFEVWLVTGHELRDDLLVDFKGLIKILILDQQVLILSLDVL